MKCLSVSALRMSLLLALAAIASPAARAQISSPAFDPNCYQPRIGVPREIDTIIGSYDGQQLGAGMINIGPSPENPGGPGRLMFGGLAGDSRSYSAVDCGANFDPHHMTVAQFKGFWDGSKVVFGHFRTKQLQDILLMDSLGHAVFPKIYWSDEKGNYDTSRWTVLAGRKLTDRYSYQSMVYYIAPLVSDTIDDIALSYSEVTDSGTLTQRNYLGLFLSGAHLLSIGNWIRPDSEVILDSNDLNFGRGIITGDFRGTGRKDLIAIARGNLFFYKNSPSFELNKLAHVLIFDTLLSSKDDVRIPFSGWPQGGLGMRALSKQPGDSSFDLVLPFDSNGTSYLGEQQLRIFRGGPEFGSHRLTIDSAYTIHNPSALDSNTFRYMSWGLGRSCGDMTGTGRPMLYLGGFDQMSFVGASAFYVLGDAIDEKVDMYFEKYLGGGGGDTCTIDSDGLQDVAFAYRWSKSGSTTEDEGAVLFIHGSKKIPVRLNRVEVRKTNPALEGAVTVSPNPCSRFTVVTWESSCSGEVHLTLRDLLGKTVFEETRPTTGDLECFRLDLPPLANGEYFLELQQEPCSQVAKIVVKN